jgi:hypothetical protein
VLYGNHAGSSIRSKDCGSLADRLRLATNDPPALAER